jgi:hypothetical protein
MPKFITNIKQWAIWKITNPTIDKFIELNCKALLEEFPDLEYIQFKYRKKDYNFQKQSLIDTCKSINN